MVALAANARVIHLVSYDLDEVNREHFAYQDLIGGAEHHHISHGGRGSIVKRAPLLPIFPTVPAVGLGSIKLGKTGIAGGIGGIGSKGKLFGLKVKTYKKCVVGTLGLCFAGK